MICNSLDEQGYVRPKEYLATEWPIKSTTGDFWSLVYDHDVTSVVILYRPGPLEASVRATLSFK